MVGSMVALAPLHWVNAMVAVGLEIVAATVRAGSTMATAGQVVFPTWCLFTSGSTLSAIGLLLLLGAISGPACTERVHMYPRRAVVWPRWERARCPAIAFYS